MPVYTLPAQDLLFEPSRPPTSARRALAVSGHRVSGGKLACRPAAVPPAESLQNPHAASCTRADSSSLSIRALRRPIISIPRRLRQVELPSPGDQGNALDDPEANIDEFVPGTMALMMPMHGATASMRSPVKA